jgi:hypothetical protein
MVERMQRRLARHGGELLQLPEAGELLTGGGGGGGADTDADDAELIDALAQGVEKQEQSFMTQLKVKRAKQKKEEDIAMGRVPVSVLLL